MSISVGVHEAKTNLSRLMEAAESGEEVVITRRGKPAIVLHPVDSLPRKSMYGALEGRIWMAGDFDELPDEVLEDFEDGHPGDPLWS